MWLSGNYDETDMTCFLLQCKTIFMELQNTIQIMIYVVSCFKPHKNDEHDMQDNSMNC